MLINIYLRTVKFFISRYRGIQRKNMKITCDKNLCVRDTRNSMINFHRSENFMRHKKKKLQSIK